MMKKIPSSAPPGVTRLQFATLASQLDAAVLLEDGDRRVHLVNQPWCDWFNLAGAPDAHVGRDSALLEAAAAPLFGDADAFLKTTAACRSASALVSGISLNLRDGPALELDYVPIRDGDSWKGHLWIYRDVTARRDAQRQGAASERALKQLVDHLTHELRSPLSALLGATALLRTNATTREASRVLDILTASSSAIRFILEEAAARSQTGAAALPLLAEPTSLRALLEEVDAIHSSHAQAKGLTLRLMLDTSPADRVVVDRGRFRQVVGNLVSNGIRYTREGFVEVFARARPAGSDTVAVTIRVRDTGCGVRESDIPRLFDAYWRGHPGHEGFGLGLHLCSRVVAAMGGEIRLLASSPGGSIFEVLLSIPVAPPEASPPAPAPEATFLVGKWVLVVEDDRSMLRLLSYLLEEAGAFPLACESAAQARAAVRQTRPDLVIADISLRDGDGLSLMSVLRAGGLVAPVVMLSAHEARFDEEISSIGRAWRLTKPIDRDTLFLALEQALRS